MSFNLDAYVRQYTAFYSWAQMQTRMDAGYRPTINTRHYPRGSDHQKAFRQAVLDAGYSVFSDGAWHHPNHKAAKGALSSCDASGELERA